MKLHVLEIPDQPKERALWLEEQIVGLDLAAVVTELYTLGEGEPLPEKTLEQVLGSALPAALEQGLTVLTPAQLRELIRCPALLLQLQVQVFVEGGAYWHQRSRAASEAQGASGEMTKHVETGRAKMRLFLQSQRPALLRPEQGKGGGGNDAGHGNGIVKMSWYRSPLLASLATAAVLAVGVFAVKPFSAGGPPVTQQGWGWSRPGAIDESLTPQQYLTKLSEAANDWHKKTPATPAELAKRIGEFRQGCSSLILSEHKPLKAEDKAWLIERCQAWAKKLDQHLADIESGKDVLEVRAQADETVNKLIKALADRAAKA
jgi:hypothetical protein